MTGHDLVIAMLVLLVIIVAALVWALIADIRDELRYRAEVERQLRVIAPLLPRASVSAADDAERLNAAVRAAGRSCCSGDDVHGQRPRRQWRDAPGRGDAAQQLLQSAEGGIGPVAALGLADSEGAGNE